MKWFRSNVKYSARVALFALAVQLGLSFGHFHAIAAQAAPSIQSTQQLPAPAPDSDQHPDDFCAICAVMAMANAVLLATPPVVLQPHPVNFSYVAADAEFVRVASVRVAFQPRAPPLS
jgi:hypothetical protein